MTRDVLTVRGDDTLATTVERMLDRRVGSAVVTVNDDPAGIVTESDALAVARRTDGCLTDVPVGRVASSPLLTIEPGRPLRAAVDRMIDGGVKKLPVVDGYELVGILTLTDVAWHYSDIRKEAASLVEEGRRDWNGGR